MKIMVRIIIQLTNFMKKRCKQMRKKMKKMIKNAKFLMDFNQLKFLSFNYLQS